MRAEIDRCVTAQEPLVEVGMCFASHLGRHFPRVASGCRLRYEHRSPGMGPADPGQLRRLANPRRGPTQKRQPRDDPVHHRQRHLAERRLPPRNPEERIALLPRGDRRPGPADWQDAVPKRLILRTPRQIGGEVAVADRSAGRHPPIAKKQERLARRHPPGRRSETRWTRRARSAATPPRLRLEGALGLPESQFRLLHTNRRKQAPRPLAQRPTRRNWPRGRWPRHRQARRSARPGRRSPRRTAHRRSRRPAATPDRSPRRAAARSPSRTPPRTRAARTPPPHGRDPTASARSLGPWSWSRRA